MHVDKSLGRFKVRDMLTYDGSFRTIDAAGNHMGQPLAHRVELQPYTYQDSTGATKVRDQRWVDSTGAFMVGELERLDQTLHEPLASVSWGRDIDLREDVTIADEVSSFTLSTYAASGGAATGNGIGNGKAWVGKTADQISGIGLDIARVPHPLRLWAMEVKYTIPELESAAKLGRPVDEQKYAGLKLKHQMDIDEQVYIGDTSTGDTGLINSSLVTATNVVAGAGGQTTWVNKSPQEILNDVNTALTTTWQNSAWAVTPAKILIPPAQFGYISTTIISQAGTQSILKYIVENNLLAATGRGKLDIQPVKWAIGAGVGGTIGTLGTVDRMEVYTKDKERVRFPMTLLQRTPIQYDGLFQKATYFCRLGVVEVVYPDTLSFWDGI